MELILCSIQSCVDRLYLDTVNLLLDTCQNTIHKVQEESEQLLPVSNLITSLNMSCAQR